MNIIPVVYASNNNYVMPTVVSITSLLANKGADTFYRIFVIENGISPENKARFGWTEYAGGYSIEFLKQDVEALNNPKLYGYWNPTIYEKYFICDLLGNYDKCLWLDGDTIIQGDLSELYNTDLDGFCLAGVKSPEMNYNIAVNKQPWLGMDWGKYLLKCINVGVLVMNLRELRALGGGGYFTEKTLEMLPRLENGGWASEQDMFNKLLVDRIKYLPLKYNFYQIYVDYYTTRYYYPFCFDRKTIEEAFEHPVIIHYSPKPWHYSNGAWINAHPYKKFQKIWLRYYLLSPYKNVRLKRKRLGVLTVFMRNIKPVVKTSHGLSVLKHFIMGKKISSPWYDFFD